MTIYIYHVLIFLKNCPLVFFLGFCFALLCLLVVLEDITRGGEGRTLPVIHRLSAYALVKRSERLYPSRGRTCLSQGQSQDFNRICDSGWKPHFVWCSTTQVTTAGAPRRWCVDSLKLTSD